MKTTQLYTYRSVNIRTLINVSKIKWLKDKLPTEQDFARRFMLVYQNKLSEIEPFYCKLDKNETELIKQSISFFEKDFRGTYIPVYFDIPTVNKNYEIQGLTILKLYLSNE